MPDPVTCTDCAADIPAGARFCVKCGAAAPGAGEAAHEHAAPPQPDVTSPPSAVEATTEVPAGGFGVGADTQVVPPAPASPPPGSGFAPPGAAPAPGPAGAPGYAPPAGFPAAPPVAGGYQGPPTTFAPPGPVQAPPAKAPKAGRNVLAGLLGMVASVGLGVASVLPWADIDSFRGIQGAVVTGWDGLTGGVQDGLFFTIIAVLGFIISATLLSGRATILKRLALLATGAVAFGMAVYEISEFWVDVDDINGFGGSASLGIGLWVAAGAALLMVLAGLIAKRTKAEAPGAAPAGVQPPAATFGDPRAVGAVG